jgi:hypothetical protein
MKFSEIYGITSETGAEWLDPVLTVDTPLFVDPFLLYASEEGAFIGSHMEVVSFFNSVFQLIARSQGDVNSLLWQRSKTLLIFPEVEELCLGYTDSGTRGSGSGAALANTITGLLWEAVRAGIREIRHFEEVAIIGEGIGADRISDITANILRRRFATYTEEICRQLDIPLTVYRYLRGYFDRDQERWMPLAVSLPTNPYNNKPVLLAPRHYLRSLPTINHDDFWDYCYINENESLRNEYSVDITRRVDKSKIISFARRHPEIRRRYIENVERREAEPYDFENDPKGLIQWYDNTALHCIAHPLSLAVASKQDFVGVIDTMLNEFQNYVTNNNGWQLLWNDNRSPRGERATQNLFLGIVKHYCKANDIDISREVNIGRGPVDFKVAQGYQLRALLEMKLVKNTKFWNGLERQLPKYQQAEGVDLGYFIAVVQTEDDFKKLGNIHEHIKKVKDQTKYTINTVIVDARRNPPSASTL